MAFSLLSGLARISARVHSHGGKNPCLKSSQSAAIHCEDGLSHTCGMWLPDCVFFFLLIRSHFERIFAQLNPKSESEGFS